MKFKYRNKKKFYIIAIISIFILFTTFLFLTLIKNNNSSINQKNKFIYYNEERLINTHNNNDNHKSNKSEKKLEHENYITKKDRKPRPDPPKKKKSEVMDEELSDSNNNSTKKKNTKVVEVQNIAMKSKVCLNGGIGYQDACICPYSYSGEQCEIRDEKEVCNNPENEYYMLNIYPEKEFGENDQFDEEYSLPSVCCWNKFRIQNNYAQDYAKETLIKPTMTNINQQSAYIKKLLQTFGPYDYNDKILFNYLLSSKLSNGVEEYYLKYSSEKYNHQDFNGLSIQSSNLAFFLLLKDISMEDLAQLFKYIYRSKHYYVIHVDNNYNDSKKFEELDSYLNKLLKESYELDHYLPEDYPKNYIIMKERFYGSWGSIGLVYPEIAAFTLFLDMVEERSKITKKDETWTHVINLSSNDFPVKTVSELEFFLRQPTNINKNFIEDSIEKSSIRYIESYLRTKNHNTNAVKFNQSNICGSEKNNNQLILDTFYKGKSTEGSQWHFISYKFAHYIISNFDPLRRLLSLKFVMVPDEIFFQQARNESPYYPNDSLWDTYNYRFIPWDSYKLLIKKEHIETKFPYITYIVRKVQSQEVKDLIIKKYLHST